MQHQHDHIHREGLNTDRDLPLTCRRQTIWAKLIETMSRIDLRLRPLVTSIPDDDL